MIRKQMLTHIFDCKDVDIDLVLKFKDEDILAAIDTLICGDTKLTIENLWGQAAIKAAYAVFNADFIDTCCVDDFATKTLQIPATEVEYIENFADRAKLYIERTGGAAKIMLT